MEFKMCADCIKKYGELVTKMHPPVVHVGEPTDCCGDPDDCVYAESGECDVVED
tara:strand:+ start:502 stop:663 length:162 start_codon:yes stop_codon:yes gene_type:complete